MDCVNNMCQGAACRCVSSETQLVVHSNRSCYNALLLVMKWKISTVLVFSWVIYKKGWIIFQKPVCLPPGELRWHLTGMRRSKFKLPHTSICFKCLSTRFPSFFPCWWQFICDLKGFGGGGWTNHDRTRKIFWTWLWKCLKSIFLVLFSCFFYFLQDQLSYSSEQTGLNRFWVFTSSDK